MHLGPRYNLAGWGKLTLVGRKWKDDYRRSTAKVPADFFESICEKHASHPNSKREDTVKVSLITCVFR